MGVYDLKNDPDEMKNKYSNPEFSSIITKMKKELKDKVAEFKVKVD